MKDIIKSVLQYFVISIVALIVYLALIIGKVNAPAEGEARCILSNDFGQVSRFDLNINRSISYIGNAPSNGAYSDMGQGSNWIKTGFITNGKPLTILAYGGWFPWGKERTSKQKYVKYVLRNDEYAGDKYVPVLSEDYIDCQMNTDPPSEVLKNISTVQSIKDIDIEDLNQYHGYALNHLERYNDHYYPGLSLDNPFDCIVGNNCHFKNENYFLQEPCRMNRGLGVYMKIGNISENGNEINYAYHIGNHLIAKVYQEKDINTNTIYRYERDANGNVIFFQMPFTLPAKIYDYKKEKSFQVNSFEENYIITEAYNKNYRTNYKFTRHVLDSNSQCSPEKNENEFETINRMCYKTVTAKWNYDQGESPNCKYNYYNYSAPTLHPNEVCPPPAGQDIFIKLGTTDYSMAEGNIQLIFISGVKQELRGISANFILDFFYTTIESFLGPQIESTTLKDNISAEGIKFQDNKVIINTTIPMYVNIKNDDIFIKFNKQEEITGTFVKFISDNKVLNIKTGNKNYFQWNLSNDSLKLTIEKIDKAELNNQNISFVISNSNRNDFFRLTNIKKGYFGQIRDFILNNQYFQTFRIIILVILIFTYGFDFLTGKRSISLVDIQNEFFRLFLLIWGTNPDNHVLLDEIIIPFFFKLTMGLSTLLLDANALVSGLSIKVDDPFDFFDAIIKMFLSKEFFLKQMAITLGAGIHIHLLIFPILWYGIIQVIKTIIGNVLFLILLLLNLGSVIMFFPIMLLVSMTEQRKTAFKEFLLDLRATCLNLALSLSFFGLFFGFIAGQLFSVFSLPICYQTLYDFSFGDYNLPLETWKVVKSVNSSEILINVASFVIVAHFGQKVAEFSQTMADKLIGKSGSLGINMGAANAIFTNFYATTVGFAANFINDKIVGGVISKGIDKTSNQSKRLMNKFGKLDKLINRKIDEKINQMRQKEKNEIRKKESEQKKKNQLSRQESIKKEREINRNNKKKEPQVEIGDFFEQAARDNGMQLKKKPQEVARADGINLEKSTQAVARDASGTVLNRSSEQVARDASGTVLNRSSEQVARDASGTVLNRSSEQVARDASGTVLNRSSEQVAREGGINLEQPTKTIAREERATEEIYNPVKGLPTNLDGIANKLEGLPTNLDGINAGTSGITGTENIGANEIAVDIKAEAREEIEEMTKKREKWENALEEWNDKKE